MGMGTHKGMQQYESEKANDESREREVKTKKEKGGSKKEVSSKAIR